MSSTPQSSSGIASNKAWLCVYAFACKCVSGFVCLCHNVQHTTVLIRDRLEQSLLCVYAFTCKCVCMVLYAGPQCPAHHSPHQGLLRTKPGCVCMQLRASVYMCLYAYATMSSTPQSSSGIASNKAWLCVYAFACKCVCLVLYAYATMSSTPQSSSGMASNKAWLCVCAFACKCVCVHLRVSVCVCMVLYAYATMSSTPQSSSGIASNKAWLCVYAFACKCVYVFVCLCHNVQHTTVLIRDRLEQSLVVCVCICVQVCVCVCMLMPQCPAHHNPHQGSPRTKPGCVCMHVRASVYMCLYAYATMSSTPQSSSGIASNKAWLCVYALHASVYMCLYVYVGTCVYAHFFGLCSASGARLTNLCSLKFQAFIQVLFQDTYKDTHTHLHTHTQAHKRAHTQTCAHTET